MFKKRQIIGMAVLTAISLGLSSETGRAAAAPQTPGASAPSSGAVDPGKAAVPRAALQADAARSSDADRLGLIQKTTDLIGKKVQDRNDKNVGKVEDLLLEIPRGLVIAVFVSSGSETEVTPVPARSFLAAAKDKVAISVDQKIFKSAPQLSKAALAGALNAKSLSESFNHFGQAMPEPAAASGRLSSGAALAGWPLISRDNQPLGQVEAIMVDVPAGLVVYLIVKPGAAPDSQGDRYILPPSSVKPEAATSQTLVLKADHAHFVAGPHFQADFWADMTRPELAAAVREHYPMRPALRGDADPTRQPVRARIESPSPKSDEEITVAVKQEIMSEIALEIEGFIARGITVKTVNGRVTITGHLKDEEEKQHILTAAKRVVSTVNVDDQLDPRAK